MNIKRELFIHVFPHLVDGLVNLTTPGQDGKVHPVGALINRIGSTLTPVWNVLDRVAVQPALHRWKQIETKFTPVWERIDRAVVQPVSTQTAHVQETYVQPVWNRIDETVIQPLLKQINQFVVEPAVKWADLRVIQPVNQRIAKIQTAMKPTLDKVVNAANAGLESCQIVTDKAIVPGLGYLQARAVVWHGEAKKYLQEPPAPSSQIDLMVAYHVAIPLSFAAIPLQAALLEGKGGNGMISTALTAGALYHMFVRYMRPLTFSYQGYSMTMGGANFMYMRAVPIRPPVLPGMPQSVPWDPPFADAAVIKKGFFPDHLTSRQALYTHWFVVGTLGEAAKAIAPQGAAPYVHGMTAFLAIYPPAQEAIANCPPVKQMSDTVTHAIDQSQLFATDEIDAALQAFFNYLTTIDEKDVGDETRKESGVRKSGFEEFLFKARKGLRYLDEILKPTQPKEIEKGVSKFVSGGVNHLKKGALKICPNRIKSDATPYVESFFDVFASYHARQISDFAITFRGVGKQAPTRLFAMAVVAITTQVVVMRIERKYFNPDLWAGVSQHSPIGAVAFVLAGGNEQTIGEVAVRALGAYIMMRSSRNRGFSILLLSTMINYAVGLYRESIRLQREKERKAKGESDSGTSVGAEQQPSSMLVSAVQSAQIGAQAAMIVGAPVAVVAKRVLVGEGTAGEKPKLKSVFNPLTLEYQDIDPEDYQPGVVEEKQPDPSPLSEIYVSF